jgi:hypothetical protein
MTGFNINKRHFFRICLALAVSIAVSHWVSFTLQWWWMPLATIAVMLTSIGNALYQGILRYLSFLIVVIIISFVFSSMEILNFRAYDITIGAFIGIAINVFIFPDRIEVSFRQPMIAILDSYHNYFRSIMNALLKTPENNADLIKLSVEKALLHLPLWMYSTGFDITLKKGYQYFVMKISEMGEVLFALHHLARFSFSNEILDVIAQPLQAMTIKVGPFFQGLMDTLSLKSLTPGMADFGEDIDTMEQLFKNTILPPPDMLEASKESVYLIEFMYNIRELREILIKMMQALREN